MIPAFNVDLDALPPPSRFRRPWSPDPYVPLPTHREPSDVSVEALDLADYARTLRPRPYPTFYPPSPLASRTNDSLSLPSLTSRAGTLSSSTHDSASYSRYPSRRPFSLPAAPSSSYRQSPLYISQRNLNLPDDPQHSPQVNPSSAEIDISQFPPWSRNWYNHKSRTKSPPDDLYDLPESLPYRHDPFDPTYTPSSSAYGAYPAYSPSAPPTSSLVHESTRDLLPWSGDPPSYDPPIDDTLKEERIRMLEREFGPKKPKPKGKGKAKIDPAFLDDDGKPIIGTVDEKGNLVTQGPKKRAATRVMQIVLALAAGIPAIYAALVIKPDPPAPPANRPPAFVLYVLSVITTLLLLYLFLFRPCCCGRKRKPPALGPGMTPGMMVLPVNGLPGGKGKKGDKKKKKGGAKGKKGKQSDGGTDVQVNLIVDPHAFAGPDVSSSESEDGVYDEDDHGFPGAFDSQRHRERARAKAKRAKRRSVFAGLAMEEAWKEARRWTKRIAFLDVSMLIVWGAEFIYILTGKRCPSGGFDGWCNAYNTSTAAACLLCVAFGVSTFFNVKDLHASKASPRTRM